jgi:xanthine/CO dehydrogenase XdhC/CoxF family maturation factor
MNAHHTVANLFALARAFGSASKDHERGTVDHDVTETAAVQVAKLGLELEHQYHLAPPPRSDLCARCGGARVVPIESADAPPGLVEVVICPDCKGTGVRS